MAVSCPPPAIGQWFPNHSSNKEDIIAVPDRHPNIERGLWCTTSDSAIGSSRSGTVDHLPQPTRSWLIITHPLPCLSACAWETRLEMNGSIGMPLGKTKEGLWYMSKRTTSVQQSLVTVSIFYNGLSHVPSTIKEPPMSFRTLNSILILQLYLCKHYQVNSTSTQSKWADLQTATGSLSATASSATTTEQNSACKTTARSLSTMAKTAPGRTLPNRTGKFTASRCKKMAT